jgi:hypothetical protein
MLTPSCRNKNYYQILDELLLDRFLDKSSLDRSNVDLDQRVSMWEFKFLSFCSIFKTFFLLKKRSGLGRFGELWGISSIRGDLYSPF